MTSGGRGVVNVKILGNVYFIYLFIFGWAGSLLLRASSLQLRRVVAHSLAVGCGRLVAVASPVEEHMLQGAYASAVVTHGLSRWGSWALGHKLNNYGAGAQLFHGVWDLSSLGIVPASPALASGFFSTETSGKPLQLTLEQHGGLGSNISTQSKICVKFCSIHSSVSTDSANLRLYSTSLLGKKKKICV